MKIDKNLFEHLTNKSSEVIAKFSDFFDHIEGVKVKVEVKDGNIVRMIYQVANYKSLTWLEDTKHIKICHTKGGSLASFSVSLTGDELIEKQVEKISLFGKNKKTIEKSYGYLHLECSPFVSEESDIEDIRVKSYTYIDFDEVVSKFKSVNCNSSIETKTLESIQNFVTDIISHYSQNLNELSNRIEGEISSVDKNGDGKVDIGDSSDLLRLLNKNQTRIIDVDKDFIHKFIRISNYLKQRSQNIQSIFSSLLHEESIKIREAVIGILKNQIHNYELLLFHSINMVVSISTYNLIAFYEIYETFDKLNVFNSNWENEVAEKLTNIGTKLDDLMYSMYNMEQNIVNELSHLSYVTQESFEDLNRSVNGQLKEIGSSIDTNNLLAGIQAYQLYKINKNTKGLRP